MTCRLLQHIKHTCDYNPGGITNIYLLDIKDFQGYRFRDDGAYSSCFVDRIITQVPFVEIGTVDESSFTETQENDIYKQQLSSFIRTLDSKKLSDLLLAAANKYLVAFRNSQGLIFCFGSDNGASLSFTQISGQLGEAAGYQVTIYKNSVYPLFEVNSERFNTCLVLGTEDKRIIMTEDKEKTLLVHDIEKNIDKSI